MAENILVTVLAVIAVAAWIWVWCLESGAFKKKDAGNNDIYDDFGSKGE